MAGKKQIISIEELRKIREEAWLRHGREIIFYHPAMFYYNGQWGRYPAISITGSGCSVECLHCRGKILETMIPARSPGALVSICGKLKAKGVHGVLISGGSGQDGRMGWERFGEALSKVVGEMGLLVSVHGGLLDKTEARVLKEAGVSQVLVDVCGDETTAREVYRIEGGLRRVRMSIENLVAEGLCFVPHIVVGVYYGSIVGEYKAVDLVSKYNPPVVIFVVLMPLRQTVMENVLPPDYDDVFNLLCYGRQTIVDSKMAFGCARPRNGVRYDVGAIDCGFQKVALPSEEAIKRANDYQLKIKFQKTCCSIDFIES